MEVTERLDAPAKKMGGQFRPKKSRKNDTLSGIRRPDRAGSLRDFSDKISATAPLRALVHHNAKTQKEQNEKNEQQTLSTKQQKK